MSQVDAHLLKLQCAKLMENVVNSKKMPENVYAVGTSHTETS